MKWRKLKSKRTKLLPCTTTFLLYYGYLYLTYSSWSYWHPSNVSPHMSINSPLDHTSSQFAWSTFKMMLPFHFLSHIFLCRPTLTSSLLSYDPPFFISYLSRHLSRSISVPRALNRYSQQNQSIREWVICNHDQNTFWKSTLSTLHTAFLKPSRNNNPFIDFSCSYIIDWYQKRRSSALCLSRNIENKYILSFTVNEMF